jgi:hypothetical protein
LSSRLFVAVRPGVWYFYRCRSDAYSVALIETLSTISAPPSPLRRRG